LISHTYKQQLLDLRKKSPNWGSTAHRYGAIVTEFGKLRGAEGVFDFVCGNGSRKRILPSYWAYSGYDPAVEGKDDLPKKGQDLAVAIDVFEHVELNFIQKALDALYERANLGVFLHISLVKAKHLLPDGRNAHITLLPASTWVGYLARPELESWEAHATDRWLRFYGRKRVTDEVE